MKRYGMFIDNHGNWHGEQTLVPFKSPKGEWIKVDDVREALQNINTICSDRTYDDIQTLLEDLV